MRTVRVYSDKDLCVGTTVNLQGDAAHHIARVLRMRTNDRVVLFNGDGQEYAGVISDINKKTVIINLKQASSSCTESPLRITLWHGICRGGRMDYVVQKATELGVHAIQPIFTSRGVVRLDKQRSRKRMTHWQRIIISAAEQSGCSRLPDIHEPRSLIDCLTTISPGAQYLMLDPKGPTGFGKLMTNSKDMTLLTGPEGGFTEEECSAAQAAGFQLASLGPRVMRTETAPVVALGIAQNIAGDLGGAR
ncbi:MAG: 16S rRNA (uracil(1498)-N(3))-methyltransferase [Gammaproteobacteria bacterium]|nr:16S rRNA (uracil(1498)-N(3))-methyltransferase [Gammaproteobacteria bacterium]MCP4276072.1 16S rRNA (uracil(1498)-N(3))-methyltransferase [Gammaproteobacteria bacterium]MCP4929642.1 16S rRNA (uracil(1498)-N(3))-methyltransferase [Gammaproteobacteria bacterium]